MMLGIPVFKRAGEAAPRVRDYAIKSIQVYDNLRQSDSAKVKKTLFTKVFTESEEGKLTVEEITSNAQAYIIAGTDTTATTMTYLVWSVCRRPDVQAQLVEALEKLPPNFTDADLKNVDYLNYIIDETLRLFAAIPSALPREVPVGGATLGDHWVPEGTTVCTQAYSMHRDAGVWPEPDHFNPDRWREPKKAMLDAFMPFGAGSRSKCMSSSFEETQGLMDLLHSLHWPSPRTNGASICDYSVLPDISQRTNLTKRRHE